MISHERLFLRLFVCVCPSVKNFTYYKKPLRKERRYKSNSDCYDQDRMINRSIQQYVPKFLLKTLK